MFAKSSLGSDTIFRSKVLGCFASFCNLYYVRMYTPITNYGQVHQTHAANICGVLRNDRADEWPLTWLINAMVLVKGVLPSGEGSSEFGHLVTGPL
jgi:hypothetical protein